MQIIKCDSWLDNNYIHIQPYRGILVKPPLMAPELKTNNSCSDSSVCHLRPLTPDLIAAGGEKWGIPSGDGPAPLCLLFQDTVPLAVMCVLLW